MTIFTRAGAALALGLALAGQAQAAAVTVTFDAIPPVSYAPGTGGAVDGGFTATAASGPALSSLVIDSGDYGSLADAVCASGTGCAANGTQAAYSFFSGGFSLSLTGGGSFAATGFDAAIGSNALIKATRFMVTGFAAGLPTATRSILLLPAGYGAGLGEDLPVDAAALPAESFQSFTLSGFTAIDTLSFLYVGALGTDPAALQDDWGFWTDFAIDNVAFQLNEAGPAETPEPASLSLLFVGLAAFAASRRQARRPAGGSRL